MQIHTLHVRSLAHWAPASLTPANSQRWHHLKVYRKGRNSHTTAAQRPTLESEVPRIDPKLDDELSKRPLNLDAAGYYVIRIDREAKEIIADYYTNIINKNGLACDPDTGEVIPCTPGYIRPPTRVYRGKTAKEISVRILEEDQSKENKSPVCSHLEHANYLGREFQRAEFALLLVQDYIQD